MFIVKYFHVADVMGPTLYNLHKMIKLPTGCGEQNLAALAVNVHVLGYLETTRQTTRKHRDKAMNYIQQGNQCRLKLIRAKLQGTNVMPGIRALQ